MSFHGRVHERRAPERALARLSIIWRGSLNVRPAVRSDAAQSSGQRSMDEKYTSRRRFSMRVGCWSWVRFNLGPYRSQALAHKRQANTVLKGPTPMRALGRALVIGRLEPGAQGQPGLVLGRTVRRDGACPIVRSVCRVYGSPTENAQRAFHR